MNRPFQLSGWLWFAQQTTARLVTLSIVAAVLFIATPQATAADIPIREIYVPFEDLNVVLESDKNRVFLTRAEYEDLIARAKTKPVMASPVKTALVAAQYAGRLEEGRALITGQLTIDVMAPGLHALPLDFGGVGIRAAMLDGQPAALARSEDLIANAEAKQAAAKRSDPRPLLIVQGQGQHQLTLELTAPLSTAAAQQTLQLRLPSTAATRLKLAATGNIEVKGGAAVIRREYDEQANRTLLELLPQRGNMAIVMSLNNRLLKDERVMVASSVIVDEVTQGYERIHATISYRILHGAADKLRIGIPAGFETTTVDSVQLARWEEKKEVAGRKTLEVTLREATSEQIVLHLTANRSPHADKSWLKELEDWTFPIVEPLETAGQVAVIGLAAENRLRAESIVATGLLPIDSTALSAAIPASIRQAPPGAPAIRQVVSYYAPAGDYSLSATLVRQPAEVHVASNSLLVIGDQGLKLQGGFAITPLAEDLFTLHLRLPADWQMTSVTAADGTPLPIERFEVPAGGTRVAVRVPRGIRAGQSTTINYQATQTPAAWLTDWNTRAIDFPRVTIDEATRETGAIAAQAVDDLVVRPASVTGLTTITDREKTAFGLAALPTALAYRFDNRDFSASLAIERTQPSITARNYAFLKLQRNNLLAHYELNYDIREARARQLAFSLPLNTPLEVTVLGLDGTTIKEVTSQDEADRRRWTVQLAQRQIGTVRLAVDFSQQASHASSQSLPLVQAEDVEYQSALVAVEGDAELEVSIATDARRADIGELSAASYQLGRHVIGTFGYVGTPADFRVTATTPTAHALPAALIQRGELVTKVSAAGRAQSVARYDLLTKATLIEARLPANSTLWSVYLDDQPIKPQREQTSLLISLPSQPQLSLRKLQLVYESPTAPLGMTGTIDAVAPLLLVRSPGRQEAREIPQADLKWQLLLPSGYAIARSGGTLEPAEAEAREFALVRVGRWLFQMAGGVRPRYGHGQAAAKAEKSTTTATVEWSAAIESARGEAAHSQLTVEPSAPPADAYRLSQPEESKAAQQADRPELAQQSIDASGYDRLSQSREKYKAIDLGAKLQDGKGLWALEGVRSLKIDIEPGDAPSASFHSLGDQPRIVAVAIDQQRVTAAAGGLRLLVLLVGVGLTRRPVKERIAFVLTALVGATLPLLVTEVFDPFRPVFDAIFLAACWLVVWYLAAAAILTVFRWLAAFIPARVFHAQPAQAVILLAIAFLTAGGQQATAQSPPPEDLTPVTVPVDAIIIPYDPEKPDERDESGKILVPYSKYVELWNQAYPARPLGAGPPPVGFAIAGTSYQATLIAADSLSFDGRLEIDVFGDEPVRLPLRLSRGVLEQMTVDGQPARLAVVESPQASPDRLFLLHLAGAGRKQIVLRVRVGLARQGGWRIVQTQLPIGPAASLNIKVPDAGTEIRQSGLADRAAFESKSPGETIELALASTGALNLQWRPKVAAAMVDQSLTAQSAAVLDVREDALRLVWQVRLEFGRGQRDAFTLLAPAGYLIEAVTGENIRGWTAKTEQDSQRIDVTLLKPATGSEMLAVQLSRRGRIGLEESGSFQAPAIEVADAALQQGEIMIRHSPRLELRTLDSTGLSRSEASASLTAVQTTADATDAAVLLTRPYQTFHFSRLPFRLSLTAAQPAQQATAQLRAALRVADRDTTLDAAFTFRPGGLPLYQVRLNLPADFTLVRLGPGDLEWSLRPDNGRQLLTIQLPSGRTEEFTLTLLGQASGRRQPAEVIASSAADAPASPRTLPIPKIEILDVAKQEGEIVILPDPDTDIRLTDLRNCEAAPIITPPAWMKPDQQPLAKSVLRFRTADYAATLNLTPRTPLVSARTLSNVKITSRSIEETVLVNFHIEQAGIRQVQVLIPSHLATARLKARLLKQKTIEPATTADGQPLAGLVRLTLDLQDDVRGDFAVLLEHDRLLSAEKQTVVPPVILTGRTVRRLLAIENAGRDEVVIDPSDAVGMEPINRQQQAWRDLATVLGDQVTLAYAVRDDAAEPRLTFSTLTRERAALAGARIGLATTLLVVDRAGTYRALVQYRVSNETEPFLQVTLPSSASLWTAFVAGEPVKPAAATPPKAGVVRIPLVKTAEGEGDYLVELKYGGQMPAASLLRSASFPLIQETSIHVEHSIVRLLLPESKQWFAFAGTMRLVEGEGQLAESYQSYLYKRIQDAATALASSSSDYTKVRAAVNLKQSKFLFDNSRSLTRSDLSGVEVEKLELANEALLERAEQQVQQQLAVPQQEAIDNRSRLNYYFQEQNVERSKNIVSELASNFDSAATAAGDKKETLNPGWYAQNGLRTEAEKLATKDDSGLARKPDAAAVAQGAAGRSSRMLRGGEMLGDKELQDAQQGQQSAPNAPAIAGQRTLDDLQLKLQEEARVQDFSRRAGSGQADELRRYQQNLERNLGAQPSQPDAPARDRAHKPDAPARGSAALPPGPGSPSAAPPSAGGAGYGGQIPPSSGPTGTPAPALEPAAAPTTAEIVNFNSDSDAALAQLSAGLASLDVQLPERGRLYRFTTPRGNIAVSARAISRTTVSRLSVLAALAVAGSLGWLLTREPSRQFLRSAANSTAAGGALVLIGLASILTGILPVAGLLLTGLGLFTIIRSRLPAWQASRLP